MNDQGWRSLRALIAWGVFGLIILIAASIIASLVFFGARPPGAFYTSFPGSLFPFHFGWLGGIFMILVFFLIARWLFLPWRNGNGNISNSHMRNHNDNSAINILKERYAKGEITKEQFEQMMLDLRKSE